MKQINPKTLEKIVYNETLKVLRNPMPEGAVCSVPGSSAMSPADAREAAAIMRSAMPGAEVNSVENWNASDGVYGKKSQ